MNYDKDTVQEIQLNTIASTYSKEIEVDFNQVKIRVRTYLPIFEKLVVAEIVAKECFVQEGILDETVKDMLSVYYYIKKYTNIIIEENVPTSYDLIIQSGLIEVINNILSTEEKARFFQTIDKAVYRRKQNLAIDNSLSNKIMASINDIPKMLEHLDKKKLKDMLEHDPIDVGGE